MIATIETACSPTSALRQQWSGTKSVLPGGDSGVVGSGLFLKNIADQATAEGLARWLETLPHGSRVLSARLHQAKRESKYLHRSLPCLMFRGATTPECDTGGTCVEAPLMHCVLMQGHWGGAAGAARWCTGHPGGP